MQQVPVAAAGKPERVLGFRDGEAVSHQEAAASAGLAGTAPCVVLMMGTRKDSRAFLYPASELAARHGASVEHDTDSQEQAYASASGWLEARRSATRTTLGPIL